MEYWVQTCIDLSVIYRTMPFISTRVQPHPPPQRLNPEQQERLIFQSPRGTSRKWVDNKQRRVKAFAGRMRGRSQDCPRGGLPSKCACNRKQMKK